MAVTSPTPWAGCTALSPTLKGGAGRRGTGGVVRNPPGAPGRNEPRPGVTEMGATGGAGGGAEGRTGGSDDFTGGLVLDFTGDFVEATGCDTARTAEPARAGGLMLVSTGERFERRAFREATASKGERGPLPSAGLLRQ